MAFYNVPDTLKHRLFTDGRMLIQDVDGNSISALIDWVLSNRPQKNDYTIIIDSTGGSPGAVMHFASFRRMLPAEVNFTGVAYGECGSAALALLQCCQHRVLVKNCGLYIHHITENYRFTSYDASQLAEVKRKLASNREEEEELIELQRKRCGMTRAKWMKLADEGAKTPGLGIYAKRARELNLVDEVVDSYPLF